MSLTARSIVFQLPPIWFISVPTRTIITSAIKQLISTFSDVTLNALKLINGAVDVPAYSNGLAVVICRQFPRPQFSQR